LPKAPSDDTIEETAAGINSYRFMLFGYYLQMGFRGTMNTEEIRKVEIKNKNVKVMTHKTALKLFDENKDRTLWDDEQEKWYFQLLML